MSLHTLRRTLHPQIRVLDESRGLVEYVASDESLDSYREVVRASGWRFNHFQKNAPFVDSHNYGSLDCLLGKVVDFRVEQKRLVETVKWATDAGLPENHLANIGFKLTVGGYAKAVSVGFWPVRYVTAGSADVAGYNAQLAELNLTNAPPAAKPQSIYLEQEQVELSAVILGANPNALARAYKAGVVTDDALQLFSAEHDRRETARLAAFPSLATPAAARARRMFLEKFQTALKKI